MMERVGSVGCHCIYFAFVSLLSLLRPAVPAAAVVESVVDFVRYKHTVDLDLVG